MILKKLVWLFIFSWKLNLNENKGRLLTSNKDIIIITILKKFKSVNIGKTSKLIWGIAIKKIADAGVGRPINDCCWFMSILNFASRNAEQIGIVKAISDDVKISFSIENLNTILFCKYNLIIS